VNLYNLGWSPFFADQLPPVLPDGAAIARVCLTHMDRAELLPSGQVAQPHQADERLQVGDWVLHHGPRLLLRLERRAELRRRAAGRAGLPQIIAANIDKVLIVSAMNRDFNPARLLRYIATTRAGGAAPLIVLTKADLAIGQEGRFLRQLPPEVPAVVTSALLDLGMEELRAQLGPGLTVALVGMSGVGKSSLINALLGEARLQVGEARDSDDRGRHTTTWRELIPFDHGVLIDTPGMRELGLLDERGLDETFADIVEAATRCRFRDCDHEGEPGCAVKLEVESERLQAYKKLQREAAWESRRGDGRAEAEARLVWKRRTIEARQRERDRGR
jgi:ribosome biogenesis GTPase